MPTTFKKSLSTNPFALIFLAGALLIGSCKEPTHDKDLVCIKVPKDTSVIGRINHFIPLMSMDIFKKDFDTLSKNLSRTNPTLYLPPSEIFNKQSLVNMLNLPNCIGLKFYYGIKRGKTQQELRIIIVGVDSAGHDLYIKRGSSLAADATEDDGGLEYGHCPPPCSNGFENP